MHVLKYCSFLITTFMSSWNMIIKMKEIPSIGLYVDDRLCFRNYCEIGRCIILYSTNNINVPEHSWTNFRKFCIRTFYNRNILNDTSCTSFADSSWVPKSINFNTPQSSIKTKSFDISNYEGNLHLILFALTC